MSKSKRVKKTTTKNTTKKRFNDKDIFTPFMKLLINMLADIHDPSVNEGRNVPDLTFDELYDMWLNCWISQKNKKNGFGVFAKFYFSYKEGKVNKSNMDYYFPNLIPSK